VVTQDTVSAQTALPNLAGLKFIVYSMLGGVTLFALVAIYVVETKGFEALPDLGPIFAGIVIGLGILGFTVNRVLARRARVARQSRPEDKRALMIRSFISRTIAQAAVVELISMTGAVFYLVSGQLGFLAVPLAGSYLLARLAKVDARFERFRDQRGGVIESD